MEVYTERKEEELLREAEEETLSLTWERMMMSHHYNI
jgi:hypothetical protein